MFSLLFYLTLEVIGREKQHNILKVIVVLESATINTGGGGVQLWKSFSFQTMCILRLSLRADSVFPKL